MPDILRLRYLGAAPALVPALGRTVEPEHLYEVPGRIVTDLPHADDCFLALVGNPEQLRSWPISMWADETPAKITTKTPKE